MADEIIEEDVQVDEDIQEDIQLDDDQQESKVEKRIKQL